MYWLLLILGILVVLALLLSRLRIGVRISFGGGREASARLLIGPCSIRLAPSRKKDKNTERTKRTPKKRRGKAGAGKIFTRPTWAELRDAYRTMMPACRRALARTRRSVRIHPFRLSVRIGGGKDPAAAAVLWICQRRRVDRDAGFGASGAHP